MQIKLYFMGLVIMLSHLFLAGKDKYVYFTSHGVFSSDRIFRQWAPYYYINGKKIINTCSTIFYPIVSFNYRDSFRHSHVKGRFKGNIINFFLEKTREKLAKLIRGWHFFADVAQANDINSLVTAINKYCTNGAKAIIQGVSRGAAVVIPTLALNPNLPVAAVILESPFDCIDSVLDGIVNRLGNSRVLNKYKYTIFTSIFSGHTPGLYKPIEYADRVNKDIPILIICSLSDKLVPFESSIRLYNALIKSGHTKTHIVILSKGRHGFLLLGDNKKLYESAVHNFYKQYGLPYDKSKINL